MKGESHLQNLISFYAKVTLADLGKPANVIPLDFSKALLLSLTVSLWTRCPAYSWITMSCGRWATGSPVDFANYKSYTKLSRSRNLPNIFLETCAVTPLSRDTCSSVTPKRLSEELCVYYITLVVSYIQLLINSISLASFDIGTLIKCTVLCHIVIYLEFFSFTLQRSK